MEQAAAAVDAPSSCQLLGSDVEQADNLAPPFNVLAPLVGGDFGPTSLTFSQNSGWPIVTLPNGSADTSCNIATCSRAGISPNNRSLSRKVAKRWNLRSAPKTPRDKLVSRDID